MLVEGDASLTTYEDGEGKKCTGFAVFHRTSLTPTLYASLACVLY